MFISLLETQFFSYLVLLLIYCISCCSLQTTGSETSDTNSVQLFQDEKITNLKLIIGEQQEEEEVPLKNIKSCLFLAAEKFIVALVSTRNEENGGSAASYLLAKYIYPKQTNFVEEVLKTQSSGTKWTTELITKNNPTDKKYFEVITSFANVKENKIYVFVINGTETTKDHNYIPYENAHITLVVGTISNGQAPSNSKTIMWIEKKNSQLSNIFAQNEEFKQKFSKFLISNVFSFVTTDKKFVLFFKGKQNENGEKNKFIFINIKEPNEDLEFLHVDAIDGCNAHLFPWDNKIYMITTDCKGSGGSVKVREFTEKEKWVDSTGHFSCLGDLLKDKRDFTPITINGSNVLLFTQQESSQEPSVSGGKYKYCLFISDGTRAKKIGIVAEDVENVEPIRLLFTEGELFTLHQKLKKNNHESLFLTRQEGLLATVKETISAWNNADNIIKKPCTSPSEINTLCVNEMPKDGVVGFLSNNASGDKKEDWHDEYHYVNAAVHEGVQVSNGFRFDKAGARAKWLIGKSKEDTLYNFADLGFTLVATVSIDEPLEPNKQRSVLGVTSEKGKKGVSVLCLKESMFAVNGNKESVINEIKNKKCALREQYYITLVYNKSKVLVYNNWEPLGSEHEFNIEEESKKKDLQFYFGADNNEAESKETAVSHVTVTNVLLYNRPFTNEEILELRKKQNEKHLSKLNNDIKDSQQGNKDDDSDQQTPGGDSEEPASFSDKITTQKNTATNEEEVQSSLHPRESTVSVNVNVELLYLVFVVVFTFGGHYV